MMLVFVCECVCGGTISMNIFEILFATADLEKVSDAVSSDFMFVDFRREKKKKKDTQRESERDRKKEKFPNKVVQSMRDKRLSSGAMLAEHSHK